MYLTEHILQKKDWHKKRWLLDVSWIHKIRGTFVALKLRSVPSSVNDFRVKWRLWAISQHFELFLASGWIMYARKEIIAFSFAILSCPSLFSRWLKNSVNLLSRFLDTVSFYNWDKCVFLFHFSETGRSQTFFNIVSHGKDEFLILLQSKWNI